ncbi:hypothetical protein LVQ77_22110, partial [Buttiauxella sp. S04-F03]|uniref:hypothetical protein n=1 Tax=Buttiauxella sp. W03-F01 TaxID=2904524 RepID=UPI001E5A5098
WPSFEHGGVSYSLSHLDAHEITYKGEKQDFKFVVTYGLHCFAKDATPFNIPLVYEDGREKITICMERYEASKQIRHILANLPDMLLYQTVAEKYFTLDMMNSATGQLEPYKICIAFYKEKRLLRMHILSAFFVRTGPGAPGVPIPNRAVSVFKVASETAGKPNKHAWTPKEANNRKK